MAILRMKRLFVAALKKDREDLLSELMKLSCVEIASPAEGMAGVEMSGMLCLGEKLQTSLETDVKKLANTIEVLDRYDKSKRPLFAQKRLVSAEEATSKTEEAIAFSEKAAVFTSRLNQLKSDEHRFKANIDSLKPYESLDVDLSSTSTSKTNLIVGTIGAEWTEAAISEVVAAEESELIINLLGVGKDIQYIFGIYPKDREESSLNILKQLGYQKTIFRDISTGNTRQNIGFMQTRLEEIAAEQKSIEDAFTNQVHMLSDLKTAYDDLSVELQIEKKTERLMETKDAFFSECWVPEESTEKVEVLLSKYDCSFEIREPKAEEEPPVLLKNSKFVTPFSTVTELYSLPAYGSMDPNPFIAVFYLIFFGMMLGDAGFGAVLAIGCFGIVYGLKPSGNFMNRLLKMLGMCGISAIVWGVLTGSYFGDVLQVVGKTFFNVEVGDLSIILSPLNDPMTMLIICLSIGIVHVFVGMGISAYLLIKRGKFRSAIFDVGFWYLTIIGLILLLLSISAGKYMAIAGAAGLVLTQGRSKKNPIMKVLSGIMSLYSITGYLADVLSYSRILALGLSSGVMASVFNTLGTLPGRNIGGFILFIIVFLVGGAFNLALSSLGSFVHSLRLNYVEFFGKFYESGGRAFDPFVRKTKYIQIIDREAI